MELMWYLIVTIAVIIVAGLAFYAGQLLWQVQEQKKQQQSKLAKRITYLTDSIRHIAQAMKAEQCEYSEGVLRIWVLLEHYKRDTGSTADFTEAYPGFAGLYEVIKDMPTHEARKRLEKKERAKLDMKRWRAEEKFSDEIDKDIEQLLVVFAATKAEKS